MRLNILEESQALWDKHIDKQIFPHSRMNILSLEMMFVKVEVEKRSFKRT